MLNLFNFLLNKNPDKIIINKNEKIKKIFPFATKEWYNSIYAYNKNTLSVLPMTSKLVIGLIKGYFNIYNRKLEYRVKRKKLNVKLRRLSSHKIYVSKGEFKHTNDRVIVNVYVYNRQKYNYMYKMNKKYKYIYKLRQSKYGLKKNIYRLRMHIYSYKYKIKKITRNITREKLFLIKLEKTKKKSNRLIKKLKNKKSILIKTLKWKNAFKYYDNLYYNKYIKKSLRRVIYSLYYKRLLLLNQFKFKYTYLQNLANILKKIYNKNVEFNIVNLKNYYLNSDIFTESIVAKLTKNRKRMFKILKTSVGKVKIANKRWMHKYDNITSNINRRRDILNKYRYIFNNYIEYNNNLFKLSEDIVLNSIKNKNITGVRIEAAGRLARRHTASRSIYKIKYKGSLINRDSSYKGLSSVDLRGNIKSNIQCTKLNSIVSIGSFGIKGWVSSN